MPRSKKKPCIRYDWTNLRAEVVGQGHGLTAAELEARQDQAHEAVKNFLAKVENGEIGFPGLPFQKDTLAQVEAYARARKTKCRNVLLLGIGGSALGATALDVLVNGPHPFRRKDAPATLYTVDNVDPLLLGEALGQLDARKTQALVVTKSGSTAETMAQFLVVYQWLKKKVGAKKAAQQVAAVTDPHKGDLLQLAREERFELFEVPQNVGGRFSVLSAVGLLPAALVGVNVKKLLQGAGDIVETCRLDDTEKNPALASALHQYILDTRYGKNIQVVYAYSNRLWPLAFWYRQLWAESLGKRVDRQGHEVWTGQTPVAALGVTDQHSQSQLYMEGPPDKAVTFWEVETDTHTVRIPKLFGKYGSTGYLGGKTLNELFHAEKFATELALAEADRPNSTFILPKADEYCVGQLIMTLQFQTAYAGEFYNINAFDQPGVELGKELTYALLGREGYDADRKRIAAYKKQKKSLNNRKK